MVQAIIDDPALRGLAVALFTAGQRIRRMHHKDPVDKASLLVLWRVSELGEPRPSEVAAEIGLDLSTISRHVRALDEDGFLARTPDPGDRRACRLAITDKGKEVVQQSWERRIAAVSKAVQHWSEEDRRTLTALLTRLTESLTEDLAEDLADDLDETVRSGVTG